MIIKCAVVVEEVRAANTAYLAEAPALAVAELVEERTTIVRMQPSATASIPPNADMDLQTMQSMDWLFKKERIYLLAQFWQQVSWSYLVVLILGSLRASSTLYVERV